MDPLCRPLVDAVLSAAYVAVLRRHEAGDGPVPIYAKREADGAESMLTAGDWQSQQTIAAVILQQREAIERLTGRSGLTLVLEETPEELGKRARGLSLIADPVDGTIIYSKAAYARYADLHNPTWAIVAALDLDGEPLVMAAYEASITESGSGPTPHPAQGLHGRLFYARKESGAFCITPPAEGFRALDAGLHDFAQAPGPSGVPQLAQAVPLHVDLSFGRRTRLTRAMPLPASAPFLLDHFLSGPADSQALRQELRGRPAERSLSAVASACRVAAGDAALFTYGGCYPWDAATRLLLAESGAATVEYRIPQSPDGSRTLLLTGRDLSAFALAHGIILTRDIVLPPLVYSANLP